jgi:hypothetical protein
MAKVKDVLLVRFVIKSEADAEILSVPFGNGVEEELLVLFQAKAFCQVAAVTEQRVAFVIQRSRTRGHRGACIVRRVFAGAEPGTLPRNSRF